MSKIVLEVSLGEALDKLTILDIKCDKIKDERKIDCQKEYDQPLGISVEAEVEK